MSTTHPCPVCDTAGAVFFELRGAPVFAGVQYATAKEAVDAARGDLELAFCPSCGMIWNVAFDESLMDYSQEYDNSLHFSKVFQQYTQDIVDRLVSRYDLKGKDVIDLGCGKGDFLAMLAEATGGRGTGFDPSFEGERVKSPAADRLTYHVDFYGEKYADHQADLITSRFVLEHIQKPVDFMQMIRRSIGDRDSVVYFEVPDLTLIVDHLSVWDIIYEHCLYFGVESLARTFARAGFEVLDVRQGYQKQFVSVEAKPVAGPNDSGDRWGDVDALAQRVARFRENFDRSVADWTAKLDAADAAGKTVVGWGAGTKAVGFFGMLGIDHTRIPACVDINPHKVGKFLAGTGQEIVSPDALVAMAPDVVIVMNPVYTEEIRSQLATLGLHPEILEAS